jgi:hypothetical protein
MQMLKCESNLTTTHKLSFSVAGAPTSVVGRAPTTEGEGGTAVPCTCVQVLSFFVPFSSARRADSSQNPAAELAWLRARCDRR